LGKSILSDEQEEEDRSEDEQIPSSAEGEGTLVLPLHQPIAVEEQRKCSTTGKRKFEASKSQRAVKQKMH